VVAALAASATGAPAVAVGPDEPDPAGMLGP